MERLRALEAKILAVKGLCRDDDKVFAAALAVAIQAGAQGAADAGIGAERRRVLAHVRTFITQLACKDHRFNGPHKFPEAVELVRLIESGEVPR